MHFKAVHLQFLPHIRTRGSIQPVRTSLGEPVTEIAGGPAYPGSMPSYLGRVLKPGACTEGARVKRACAHVANQW